MNQTTAGQVYVVINSGSYRYVRNIADATVAVIEGAFSVPVTCYIRDRWSCDGFERGSLIFVIGEPFALERVEGCAILFLNFSVVTFLGRWWDFSLEAARIIRYKRRLLQAKLQACDYLLDYWATQTERLRRELNIPVATFPVCIGIEDGKRAFESDREFDVCIVGGRSSRRRRIIRRLRDKGLRLSPPNGVVIEDAAQRSTVMMNVHTVRCNQLELPRMFAAFASGSVLVTERSYSIEQEFPADCYYCASYAELPAAIELMAKNRTVAASMAQAAYTWLTQVQQPRAAADWQALAARICDELRLPLR